MKCKKNKRVYFAAMIIIAMLCAVSFPLTADAATDFGDEDLRLYGMICAAREENGSERLILDKDLSSVARIKCRDMIENDYFGHVSPNYGSIKDMLGGFGINAYCAENIARYGTLEKAHAALMTSESHRRNILSVGFDAVGIAVGHYPDGSVVVVEIFAFEK